MATGGVEALERAFKLLECFDGEEDALSLAELARRSGLYKSTILRIIQSMDRYGYMVRQHDGCYRLGPTLWRLGSRYQRRFDLATLIRPVLKSLVEISTESASFFIREDRQRICLYRHNSSRAVRHHLVEGARLELQHGASGRVLRAYSVYAEPEDAVLRSQGYTVSLGERDADVAAVAIPLLDDHGCCRGALAVSGLITRFGTAERQLALEALRQVAADVRHALTEF